MHRHDLNDTILRFMEAPETTARLTADRHLVPPADPHAPLVSIVIPAFNESQRIGNSLKQVDAFLQRWPHSTELIVVDDGSVDTTSEVIAGLRLSSKIRVLRNPTNHGKGYSVRQGMLAATGTYVLFSDADLSAPIEEVDKLLNVALNEGAEIVIGSRAVDRTYIEKHQSSVREFGGILFNGMVRILLGLDLQDTQCGFKLFHRNKTRTIFEKQTTAGFGFDPEILFLAYRRHLRIREVPVRWSHSEGSKVRFLRDGTRMFVDLVRIRWNYIIGRYS
jgi:glycosyltransferase involved in cell wall biosynthesis